MTRVFTMGSGENRRLVQLEVTGSRLRVTQKKADGEAKRTEKELKSEADALIAFARMAQELTTRGFVEKPLPAVSKPKPRPSTPKPAPKPAESPDLYALEGGDDEPDAPLLPRSRPAPEPAPGADAARPKKKSGKKKRKKADRDGLDPRILAAIAAVGACCLAFVGYFVYDVFLKAPSIEGVWAGSMIDFEIGGPIEQTEYRLVLDDQNRASLTLQAAITSTGTYAVKGDRLILDLKEEDDGDDEGEGEGGGGGGGSTIRREYKIALGRATLDLFDPDSGKKLVQLIRFREEPVVAGGGGGGGPAIAPPRDLAVDAADKDADARLVSIEFGPKDNAFKLRHPPGWQTDTGGRPDNTYSWVSLTKGSARVQVFADVLGSLMSGSDSAGQHEEGSELAPVHNAHVLYRKTAAEQYNDYQESAPALFKGSSLGEGRVASFVATEGAVFGTSLRGYRVTLLTNDRRISVLCQCPVADFDALKPTFLALCRSLQR